jgi:hypothetical protein
MFEQHSTFLFISCNSQKFQQIAFNVDGLQMILDLETDDTTIVIQSIHDYYEYCGF